MLRTRIAAVEMPRLPRSSVGRNSLYDPAVKSPIRYTIEPYGRPAWEDASRKLTDGWVWRLAREESRGKVGLA